jgi:nucleoside 2-deoxyribosyltransferase
MNRIYVAGGFLEKDAISQYMRRLEAAGYVITQDWTVAEATPAKLAMTSDADLTEEESYKIAKDDLKGVADADIVWHIVASYKGSRGAYVEVGYALGLKQLLVVSGPDRRKSVFHSLADEKFDLHEQAFDFLVRRLQRERHG